jgi:hypothetical protein
MDGRIAPTNSYHIDRAYALRAPLRVRAADGPPTIAKIELSSIQTSRVSRLVAGAVQGKIDFSGAQPTQDASALAMYRHPAERNAAATGVSAGRMIDVTG